MTSATDFYATQMRGEEACRQNPTHATRSPPLQLETAQFHVNVLVTFGYKYYVYYVEALATALPSIRILARMPAMPDPRVA